ncbi:hypothetical protein GW17_00017899 [Ensete ventricosum]|nr:hypothetical protein GW17_00017899 [Ensete ventricosum]RZR99028.1 hypothetical protein BHM03_00028497 [Ensete ventricosum]
MLTSNVPKHYICFGVWLAGRRRGRPTGRRGVLSQPASSQTAVRGQIREAKATADFSRLRDGLPPQRLRTDKMRKGVPLTDEDRFPWLEALRDAVGKIMSSSKNVTLTCSALQKKYREILRSADADYKPGQYTSCRVKFICLEAPVEVIADRIRRRSKEGKHFMPVSLLQSQLDLLQIDEAEGVIRVDATMSREAILESILTSHF